MKKIVILLLIVAVVALFFFLWTTRDQETASTSVRFEKLLADAARPADLDATGPSWPDDDLMRELRAAWHTVGSADSTRLEQLNAEWIYPVSRQPHRLTTVGSVRAGTGMDLADRLRFGEILVTHPEWRLGTMRHFPAAAAVLTADEKAVLQFIAKANAPVPTAEALAQGLYLETAGVEKVLDDFTALGWVAKTDSTYSLTASDIADGGAMNVVTLTTSDGRQVDVVSVSAALEHYENLFREAKIQLRGSCAQTGRSVVIDIAGGRLRTGRPGKAYAVELGSWGLTGGLFASEQIFTEWKTAHPEVETGKGSRVPTFFHEALSGS